MKPRVFIADDHELFREGIKALIERKGEYQIVGELKNGIGLVDLLIEKSADILLLDFSMPGKNGLELIPEIKNFIPNIKILVVTMHPEERFAVRCLKAGADGYMTKNSAAKDLIFAISKILNGRKYISDELAQKLAVDLGQSESKPHENLSDREYQVFVMLAQGRSNSEISEELHLSPSTVNTYRNRIKEKMKLDSIADIIRYALENKLVE
ncbi:MAG: response regulator transcription factor [Calditrichae bacterium]|nr:response regulator transcription factor [Calditrichota bacterium]MCB9058751.1 response regulator transcription factor [Calditrichia bacterium]